jgi:hypothetical protein
MATVYYVDTDGNWVRDKSVARFTSPASICAEWLRCTRVVPPQFALGTALHESSYKLNEVDVEPNGHTTGGLFQSDLPTLSPFIVGDAIVAGMPEKNIFYLEDACAVFAAMCERSLGRIYGAVDAWNDAHGWGPIDRDNPPADVWAYLAIAHNQGAGAAVKTIRAYGLDWTDYKRRNPTVNIAMARAGGTYGDDVISGGPDWREEYGQPFEQDDAGNMVEIPEPTISAGASSQLRLGLLALLALLVAYAVMTGAKPWKVMT